MRYTVLSVFMFRAESHRIFPTPFIDPFQSITITIRMIVSTAGWWFVQFDGQVDIGVYVCCREKNVEKQNDKDRYQLHLKVKYISVSQGIGSNITFSLCRVSCFLVLRYNCSFCSNFSNWFSLSNASLPTPWWRHSTGCRFFTPLHLLSFLKSGM